MSINGIGVNGYLQQQDYGLNKTNLDINQLDGALTEAYKQGISNGNYFLLIRSRH